MTEHNPFHDDQGDPESAGPEEKPAKIDGLDYKAPWDEAAEQAILGAMLLDRTVIDSVTPIVKGKHFYRPAHETIWENILELHAAGEIADPITLHKSLVKAGDDLRCKSPSYLHDLIRAVPAVSNAAEHAEIVREKWVARDFAQAAFRAGNDLVAGKADPREVIAAMQARIAEAEGEQAEDGLHVVADSMGGTLDKLEAIDNNKGKINGVPTGFRDLDALTQGWQGGQFILVAARPAMGKSTLALDFQRACSITHGLPSVLFSLEMGRHEVNMRLLSAEARVGLHLMRSGNMDDDDWTRVARRMPDVTAAPLYVDDSPNLDLMQIWAKCRRMVERYGLKLVIIDYLQLMGSGSSKRFESRQIEVSFMSRNLKLLAKELDIPVIALSQLNRGPEQRADKKPMVSDLRESGSLEQDADMVILLHREDAYEKESPRAGEADLIVGKHRAGATATITVGAQLHYSKFVDFTRDEPS